MEEINKIEEKLKKADIHKNVIDIIKNLIL